MVETVQKSQFWPLDLDIVAPEGKFDFEIKEDWAKYSIKQGEKTLDGYLGLKGTIDLLTRVDEKTLEIVDWKTGKRWNWAKGTEKTQASLQDDPQLRLYHYAASKLYPDVDQIIVTIFFIRDGGPYTMLYTKDDLPKTEEMIRTRFEEIKKTKKPQLNKTWMCSKLCHFGKNTFKDSGSSVLPIVEFRRGQVNQKGDTMTMCAQVEFEIARKGIDKVVQQYTHPDHKLGHYQDPGGGV